MRYSAKLNSGTGRGRKFIAMPVYSKIFQELLGKPPFAGTLNLTIPVEAIELVNEHFSQGKIYDDLKHGGKPTGGIVTNYFNLHLGDRILKCVGVKPKLTVHNGNTLEIVSHEFIRKKFNLNDNDTIIFEITQN